MNPRHLMLAIAACFGALVHAQAPPSSAPVPAGVPPATTAPVAQPLPPSRWTAAEIREAFQRADANGDGHLTRAEAQHLPIMPRTFEDSDLNKDGVLTPDEYQASFAPIQ